MDSSKLSRQQFLVGALGGGALVVLSACADDEKSSTPAPAAGDCTAENIQFNHGHSLDVPKADVTAGAEKTYSIRGSATHDHTVTLTAAHFKTLASGQTVVVTSSSGASHTHEVTVGCPA